MIKNILIIGGYGTAGSYVADFLTSLTDHQIFVGGRNIQKAEMYANYLNKKYKSDKVKYTYIDLKNDLCFENIDIVVLAAPGIQYYQKIVNAMEKYKIAFFDLTPPSLEKYMCFPNNTKNLYVTDVGGAFPLTMIKYIASSNITKALVFNYYNVDWNNVYHSSETVPEFERAKIYNKDFDAAYKDEKWYSVSDIPKVVLNGEEYDTTWYKEMYLIPMLYKNIKEFGCFYRTNNYEIQPEDEHSILTAYVDDIILNVKTKSAYYLTGAGAVCAILQFLDNPIITGLFTAGEFLNPELFFYNLTEKFDQITTEKIHV